MDFIVTPGFNEKIVKICLDKEILIIPGVATPSEIEKAISYGIKIVKLFPVNCFGGTEILKAYDKVYKNIKFIPMGGVSLKNKKEYLELNNVIAVGGSNLIE